MRKLTETTTQITKAATANGSFISVRACRIIAYPPGLRTLAIRPAAYNPSQLRNCALPKGPQGQKRPADGSATPNVFEPEQPPPSGL